MSDLPVLYRRPVALDRTRHARFSLRRLANFTFTQGINSVPINVTEFSLISHHYPIVFAPGDPPSPVAVLGVRPDRNLFVQRDGSWADGAYVPAYVRRYPFLFSETDDKQDLILCVDEASNLVVEDASRPLFENGEPSEVAKHALAFCTEFQSHHVATVAFAKGLSEQALLVPNRADVALASGEKLTLSGFGVVDEGRFSKLSDDVFLDWRRRGWLHLVYGALMSTSNWGRLADLEQRRTSAS